MIKYCFPFSTLDGLELIPFLWMFDETFIRSMGKRFTNPNKDLLYQKNYISDFLLEKLDGVVFSGCVDKIKYNYNFSDTRSIRFSIDNEILFDL